MLAGMATFPYPDWRNLRQRAAGTPSGVVHLTHKPIGSTDDHVPGVECWCCPLALTSGQIVAISPVELQKMLDRNRAYDA